MARGWQKSNVESYERRQNRAGGEGTRPRAVLQEQQNVDSRKIDHRPKKAKVDGKVHPKFRVAITLFVSDKKRRDGDGAATTLLDALVESVRRFGSMDASTSSLRDECKKR